MAWKILIERGNLEFSAAHFITFEGECEPLHGHNYGVRVEAEGELTADSYVVDFVVMKDIVRTLIKRWDHRFLLPLANPHLRVTEQADAWEIEFAGEEAAAFLREHGRIHYSMPKWSVVPLPVDNATAERLAEQLALAIADELSARGVGGALTCLTVGVEETAMQTAFYTLDPRLLGNSDSASAS
jgi:6-pyruvoyltetrahydropterin/6-carboxytetrahydropterin synthase